MKLVVGLGNPGPRYERTRHNAGRRVLERFGTRAGIALSEQRFGGRFGRGHFAPRGAAALELGLLAPETFMNRSGDAVVDALEGLAVEDPGEDLFVVLDDVDLPFGRLRLRPSGGAGGHRGLEDVIATLGHGEFPRLRFGVGRPEGGDTADTADWVLAPFAPEEERALEAHLAAAADALEEALASGVAAAMNRVNRAPDPEATKPLQ